MILFLVLCNVVGVDLSVFKLLFLGVGWGGWGLNFYIEILRKIFENFFNFCKMF